MISPSDGGGSTSSGTSSENHQQRKMIQEGRRLLAARNAVFLHDPYEGAATATTRTWFSNDDTPPPPPHPQVSRESAAPAPACFSNHELIALKEARRLEKNRVKAKNARKRKKCMIADLEQNVKVVTQENEVLRVENSDLRLRLMEAELREGKAAADAAGRQAHQNHAANIALAAAASGRGSMTPLSTGVGLGTGAGAGMDDLLNRHMDRHQLDLNRSRSLGQRHGRAADLLRDHPTGDALASQLIKGNSWVPPESLSALPAFRDAMNSLAGEELPMHSSSGMRGVPGGIAAAAAADLIRGPGGLALSSLGQPPQLTSPARINIGAVNAARLPLLAGGSGAVSASALSFLENQKHHHLLRGVAAADAARGGGDDRDIFARRGGGLPNKE